MGRRMLDLCDQNCEILLLKMRSMGRMAVIIVHTTPYGYQGLMRNMISQLKHRLTRLHNVEQGRVHYAVFGWFQGIGCIASLCSMER
jgi:hypothetical protein